MDQPYKKCDAPTCNAKSVKTGLCIKHYKRKRQRGEQGLLSHFECKTCKKEISYRTYFSSEQCNDCWNNNYYQNNKQKWVESKVLRAKELEKYREEYYIKNRDKLLAKDKVRSQQKEHKLKRNARYQKYRKAREQVDENYKLRRILRNRLNAALKNKQKVGSAVKDLGCSIEDLMKYLESKFEVGMSWSNHGEWHIDHIKPLKSFNLQDMVEFKEACHYTNLQPLWTKDHFKKTAEENRGNNRKIRKICG